MAIRSMERSNIQKRRINIAFLTILACYLALMARLLYLQGMQGAEIRAQARKERMRTIPKTARRGSILDRDGALLATSLYAGEVGFDPAEVSTDGKDARTRRKIEEGLARSINIVADELRMPRADLEVIVAKARADYHIAVSRAPLPGQPPALRPTRFVRLQKNVGYETAQIIRETRPRLSGFGVVDGSLRAYASGPGAAHVVGFLGGDPKLAGHAAPKPVGHAGLERSCETWLKGEDGYAVAELDDHRREIADTQQLLKPAPTAMMCIPRWTRARSTSPRWKRKSLWRSTIPKAFRLWFSIRTRAIFWPWSAPRISTRTPTNAPCWANCPERK